MPTDVTIATQGAVAFAQLPVALGAHERVYLPCPAIPTHFDRLEASGESETSNRPLRSHATVFGYA